MASLAEQTWQSVGGDESDSALKGELFQFLSPVLMAF
jgi:hypothetical protein